MSVSLLGLLYTPVWTFLGAAVTRQIASEQIGVGALLSEDFQRSSDLPDYLPSGLAVGQHLRIERLIRVQEQRMSYLVNNIGPKWRMRKCWSCGNKYSPTSAQACTYCGAPLLDQRFLMTQRWDAREFDAWNSWLHAKNRDPLILSPVAMVFRKNQMLSVYHYDGARLLIDAPSPLPRRQLYAIATQLAHALHFLHSTGARLRSFTAQNVLLMPDNSVRFLT